MMRISVVHWLPIADNMLPEIRDAMKLLGPTIVSEARLIYEAVRYEVWFPYVEGGKKNHFLVRGFINQQGFTHNVLDVTEISSHQLSGLLDSLIPQYNNFLAQLLFSVVPMAVRNKLAVLREGIYSFTRFETERFSDNIDTPAEEFLERFHFTSIMLDVEYISAMRNGFVVPSVKLVVPRINESHDLEFYSPNRSFINSDGTCVLFYADVFHQEEGDSLEGIIYKYCALATFSRFATHVIVILKQTRDHVVPLRRKLAIALQRNTEEYFVDLTEMKKYLTYVNIKLPVIGKVLNHLKSAYPSDIFVAKIRAFASDKIYPAIQSIDDPLLRPSALMSKIKEDIDRLAPLFKEDLVEIDVFSNELSQVLQGSLLAESLQVSERELDASRASLELNRGSKNRANALMVFSFLVSANLGLLIAGELDFRAFGKLFFGLAFMLPAWYFTTKAIQKRSSYLRLVIPVNSTVSRKFLEELTNSKDLKRAESNGSHRISTWIEKLQPQLPHGSKNILYRWQTRKLLFDVTIDYETRGYIHSFTIEKEYNKANFDIPYLVIQLMDVLGCEAGEASLLVEAFKYLDIPFDSNLKGLNKVLSLTPIQLEHALLIYKQQDIGLMLTEDKDIFEEIFDRRDEYLAWLIKVRSKENIYDTTLLKLLGEKHLKEKIDIIRKIET